MVKKALVSIISTYNKIIDRKLSRIKSFKASRFSFKKRISELSKHNEKVVGGDTLSKNLFVKGLQARIAKPFSRKTKVKLDLIKHDLFDAGSSLRKAKKMRKNLATGRIKFIRIRGRIVPIRMKK